MSENCINNKQSIAIQLNIIVCHIIKNILVCFHHPNEMTFDKMWKRVIFK